MLTALDLDAPVLTALDLGAPALKWARSRWMLPPDAARARASACARLLLLGLHDVLLFGLPATVLF